MLLEQNWGQGGESLPPRGAKRPSLRDLLNAAGGLTIAEAKALPPDELTDGMRVVTTDGKRWRYMATSALVADGDNLVIVPTTAPGRLLVEPGSMADLKFAMDFSLADAATIYTVPTNAAFLVHRGYWEVTTGWTGGASSTIGMSSNQAPHTVKGDLLGGAAGDLGTTLVVGNYIEGVVGTDQAAGIILKGGQLVRYDEITSAFTAGAGFGHLVVTVLANPGV
jgi:hypothetical protein